MTLSEETKNKISNTLTGRVEPEETKKRNQSQKTCLDRTKEKMNQNED